MTVQQARELKSLMIAMQIAAIRLQYNYFLRQHWIDASVKVDKYINSLIVLG